MPLDTLDLMLIEELENDARQPVPVLAKKLGMKRTTARYRLNRLITEGILTITCIGDPELLGYQFLLVAGINVAPGKAEVVAKRLADLSEVKIVCLAAGRYRILIWALFRDRLSLAHFQSENMTHARHVTAVETMLSYQWVKSYWKYFKPQKEIVSRSEDYESSELDLAIIRAMQKDPRQAIKTLAKTVGCSATVAKRRLDRLIKERVLRFACIVSPTPMGWEGIAVAILIETQPDKVFTVADELSAQDPARLVSLIIGQWHIFFGATFEDAEHMHRFLSETLDSIPGIVKYEIIHLTNILKYDIISVDWADQG